MQGKVREAFLPGFKIQNHSFRNHWKRSFCSTKEFLEAFLEAFLIDFLRSIESIVTNAFLLSITFCVFFLHFVFS